MFIVMAICLLADASTCREERINFSFEDQTAMACIIAGQQVLAEWQNGHPEWQVRRWRCVPRDGLSTRI